MDQQHSQLLDLAAKIKNISADAFEINELVLGLINYATQHLDDEEAFLKQNKIVLIIYLIISVLFIAFFYSLVLYCQHVTCFIYSRSCLSQSRLFDSILGFKAQLCITFYFMVRNQNKKRAFLSLRPVHNQIIF